MKYNEEIKKEWEIDYDGKFIGIKSIDFIKVLGYIQVVCSTVMFIFWIIIYCPIILKKQWRQFVKANRERMDIKIEDENLVDVDINELNIQETNKLLHLYGPENKIFNDENGNKRFTNNYTKLVYYYQNIQFIFKHSYFNYLIFYLLISYTGLFVSEFVYCFHMFEVVFRSPTLNNAIKAVSTNVKSLSLTFFLGKSFNT